MSNMAKKVNSAINGAREMGVGSVEDGRKDELTSVNLVDISERFVAQNAFFHGAVLHTLAFIT